MKMMTAMPVATVALAMVKNAEAYLLGDATDKTPIQYLGNADIYKLASSDEGGLARI